MELEISISKSGENPDSLEKFLQELQECQVYFS